MIILLVTDQVIILNEVCKVGLNDACSPETRVNIEL